MTPTEPTPDDPADTEITIAADGRVFVHGLSREVVEVLGVLDPHDAHVARVLDVVRDVGARDAGDARPPVGKV